ncbi:MAG: hypothetical protein LRY36_01700 [Alphaproteobacteria bacterium]|nr:hypothetical protein [Alphaproteobacteria bacterium]
MVCDYRRCLRPGIDGDTAFALLRYVEFSLKIGEQVGKRVWIHYERTSLHGTLDVVDGIEAEGVYILTLGTLPLLGCEIGILEVVELASEHLNVICSYNVDDALLQAAVPGTQVIVCEHLYELIVCFQRAMDD